MNSTANFNGCHAVVIKNNRYTCDNPLRIGEEFTIEDSKYGVLVLIPVRKDNNKIYHVSEDVFEDCFKIIYDKPTEYYSLTPKDIDNIMENCEINVSTVFGKCTTVSCKLPNGFVLVESSACVDAQNYDEHIGLEICLNRIRDRVWELEGYRLQQIMYEHAMNGVEPQTTNTKVELPCTCNKDCDECFPPQSLCPYKCNDDCNNCEKQKGM